MTGAVPLTSALLERIAEVGTLDIPGSTAEGYAG